MKSLQYLSIALSFLSCKNEKEIKRELSTNHIKEDTLINRKVICVLKNNIELFGDIKYMTISGDNRFIISTSQPPNVIVYDFNGNQMAKIGSQEKGPYQYLQPSVVKYFKNNIFIWCAIKLRLIVYDMHGNPHILIS